MKVSESKYCHCIYFVSNALARKVSKLAEESWKPVGLSPSHAYLLLMAIERPGIQPTELVDQLQLTPSTITRLLQKLEGLKLVARVSEGKLIFVYATPRGQAKAPELKVCLKNFYTNYTRLLGTDESASLVQNMSRIADLL
jgi:DNA-binding MarR family transcriptional regulator